MSDPVTTKFEDRSDVSAQVGEAADKAKAELGPAVATFKEQAGQAAQDAKATVTALAEEARTRFAEIVDQKKSAGADQVSGVARAAQTAASDLEKTSPQLASLVRSAAEQVDHVAEGIRGSDISDVIASLSKFGRRQPVAFFGGAVVVGFLLARFLKSDTPRSGTATNDRSSV